jgi:hypothetical protein
LLRHDKKSEKKSTKSTMISFCGFLPRRTLPEALRNIAKKHFLLLGIGEWCSLITTAVAMLSRSLAPLVKTRGFGMTSF